MTPAFNGPVALILTTVAAYIVAAVWMAWQVMP